MPDTEETVGPPRPCQVCGDQTTEYHEVDEVSYWDRDKVSVPICGGCWAVIGVLGIKWWSYTDEDWQSAKDSYYGCPQYGDFLENVVSVLRFHLLKLREAPE